MKTVNEVYGNKFFAKRHKVSWRVPYVCDAICKVINPTSVIDVGCGIGDYVLGFGLSGVDAMGLEGSKHCIPYLVVPELKVFIRDFRELIEVKDVGCYELVLCLEVLEHIDEEFANTVVYNFSQMSNKILVSAAPPGQGGYGHVNCQPQQYWVEKFNQYGYEFNQFITNEIKKEWKPVKHKREMSAYYNNLLYFEKNEI